MRILIVHNRYKELGGEDAVVKSESEMLQTAGHSVRVISKSNDIIVGNQTKIKVFLSSNFNKTSADWIKKEIKSFDPDIVHIHNFWPVLSPSIHFASSNSRAAVVQTLHNFRLICSGAQLMRNGKICEKCIERSNIWGILHKCYRNSCIGSLAVFRMQNTARRIGMLDNHVQKFIALTSFAKKKFIEGGIDKDQISIKPNSIPIPQFISSPSNRDGLLYVGRLSEEKGLDTLIKAAQMTPNLSLKIIGDGPLRNSLERSASKNVKFLGFLDKHDIQHHMLSSRALVMPSRWYEGFPITLLEAFGCELPVIASKIGSLEELVEDGVTGFHFPPNNFLSLAKIFKMIDQNPEKLAKLGVQAKENAISLYDQKSNIISLENIYNEAIKSKSINI